MDLSLANASPGVSVSGAHVGVPSEGGRGSSAAKGISNRVFTSKCVVIKIKLLVLVIKNSTNVIHNYNRRENIGSL